MSVAEEARNLAFGVPAHPAEGAASLGRIALIAAICVIPVVLYLPFLAEPFMRDEGFYAAVAQQMLDGGIPYRDAFDNKPPMIFVWYALSFLMFGETVWAPRLLVSLLLSGTTLLVYLQGRLLFGRQAGLLAALAFALSIGLAVFETNANTEYFMLLPLVGSVYCFTLAERNSDTRLYLLSGFLMGFAILTKDTAVFILPLLMLVAVNRMRLESGWSGATLRALFKPVGGLVLGCGAAGLLTILPFVLTGTFDDMFNALFVYTLDYVGVVSWTDRLEAIGKMPVFLFWLAGPWAVLSAVAVFHLARSRDSGHGLLLIGWVIATVFGIVAAGRFYDHYYVALLPVLALLVPLGLRGMQEAGPFSRRAIAVVVALSLVPMLVASGHIYLQPNADARHTAKYPNDERSVWETQGDQLGAWLAARTSPDDYIYNFGFHSEIYFHADRQSPTRYLFDHPFRAGDQYVAEALDELNANPPLYIVDTASYEYPLTLDYYSVDIGRWINAYYDYVGRVYYADVYKLRPAIE
jgi:4-amino-4-deoxy-L-arabinose transferase-like glycosyltransferase